MNIKKGDLIKLKADIRDIVTKGKVYKVIEVDSFDDTVKIYNDNGNLWWVSKHHFEPAKGESFMYDSTIYYKIELKSGMVVESREGSKYLVVGDTLMRDDGYTYLDRYCDDLSHSKYRDLDIMAVYNPDQTTLNSVFSELKLVWQREKTKEMTVKQINDRLKELGEDYKVKVIE